MPSSDSPASGVDGTVNDPRAYFLILELTCMNDNAVGRRSVLTAAGLSVIGGLAGCLGDDDGDTHTVSVGHDGNHVFGPDELTIAPGDTVNFVWDSSGHNIVVTNQPDDSDWDGVAEIQDEGYEHEHTFEIEGLYEFHCDPHLEDDMTAVLTVEEAEVDDDILDTDDTPEP